MVNYDLDDNPDRNRGDFLAFFRNEQAKRKDRMSDDDLVNHICNNMYVPAFSFEDFSFSPCPGLLGVIRQPFL